MDALTAEVARQDDRLVTFKLLKALEQFHEVQPDMPVSRLITFLHVAIDEGKHVKDYAAITSTPPTTMTRHLLDLGTANRKHLPGLGLLDTRIDPWDRRQHQTFLSHPGKSLFRRVLSILK